VRGRHGEQGAEVGVCGEQDVFGLGAAVGDFGEGHACVVVVEEVLGGAFEDGCRERGWAGAKVDYFVAGRHIDRSTRR